MLGRRHTGDPSRGQVLAEFTLAIPVFLLVVLGIAEGGYYVAATTIVSSATHEGARLGVLASTNNLGTIQSRVQSAAQPIVSLETGDVSLQLAEVQEGGGYGALGDCDNTCYQVRQKDDRLVVNTAYTHVPIVGYVFPGLSFPASASAELIVEGDAA